MHWTGLVLGALLAVAGGTASSKQTAYIENQYRDAGIAIPITANDMIPLGDWVPGSGRGAVDIYGYDAYPLELGSCTPAWTMDENPLTLFNYSVHLEMSPSNPVAVTEFQGGSNDNWGGNGMDVCASMVGAEFESVFQKELYGQRTTILNVYMIYGGTNWGNLGQPEGYTSYDYGAAIAEDRTISRPKYGEMKLQAQFLQSSPDYLTSSPATPVYSTYTDSQDLVTTPLLTNTSTAFHTLAGHSQTDLTWKMTGNLGGDHYWDLTRGPLNEGGMYAERQGFHLPGAPTSTWEIRSPVHDGLSGPGLAFFATSFDLDLPVGYDIPLSVTFANTSLPTGSPAALRVQLFVNGWQFGEMINNIGPQTSFPVPEGIFDYTGPNYLALTLWGLDGTAESIKLGGIALEPTAVIQGAFSKPALVQGATYAVRGGY
ncbi:hypothetical protein ASPZODRAFT_2119056 [Penicilliopsis zonata CBS 506.65]|uniref:beta-galactosidase n=1 Tax=Penicilliopsis zonata CBS 506.65 TaxID=1073090 RepID=A0A1L9S6H0_9EURO|nr:hypothetical protein ASPZODRAFT_2119056 [Penicilliopsis zonata CBS 506.65]OJJ42774.1 hypothetical protein ASPZODRAFT_2119056 [Penicilliopsis zonata CBS 506.65]